HAASAARGSRRALGTAGTRASDAAPGMAIVLVALVGVYALACFADEFRTAAICASRACSAFLCPAGQDERDESERKHDPYLFHQPPPRRTGPRVLGDLQNLVLPAPDPLTSFLDARSRPFQGKSRWVGHSGERTE